MKWWFSISPGRFFLQRKREKSGYDFSPYLWLWFWSSLMIESLVCSWQCIRRVPQQGPWRRSESEEFRFRIFSDASPKTAKHRLKEKFIKKFVLQFDLRWESFMYRMFLKHFKVFEMNFRTMKKNGSWLESLKLRRTGFKKWPTRILNEKW